MSNITIILPSINPSKWINLYAMIEKSVGNYSFNVFASGPFFPPIELEQKLNFQYIREFSCPSRALMAAASVCDSKYVTWIPDDCIVFENSLKESLDLLESKDENHALTVLYSEGPNYSGNQHLESERWYWTARNHGDQKLKWIKENWKIAPIFIYNLETFKKLGGLDCSFYHINLNTHSLAFKLQKNGGTLLYTPNRVLAANWQPWVGAHGEIMRIAYETNDLPKYKKIWDSENEPELNWEFDNWKSANKYWELRYK